MGIAFDRWQSHNVDDASCMLMTANHSTTSTLSTTSQLSRIKNVYL